MTKHVICGSGASSANNVQTLPRPYQNGECAVLSPSERGRPDRGNSASGWKVPRAGHVRSAVRWNCLCGDGASRHSRRERGATPSPTSRGGGLLSTSDQSDRGRDSRPTKRSRSGVSRRDVAGPAHRTRVRAAPCLRRSAASISSGGPGSSRRFPTGAGASSGSPRLKGTVGHGRFPSGLARPRSSTSPEAIGNSFSVDRTGGVFNRHRSGPCTPLRPGT